MATEMEVTPISDEEELEEGEIDSSDEEEEKKESESSDKLTEAAKDTPVANEGRKRHHSSTPSENSPKNDKRARVDQSDGETDLEDGEIYSDDEEAAYYPQLVKSRNKSKEKKHKKDKSRSPSLSRSRSRSPSPRHSDDDQQTRKTTDRQSRRDKRDTLDVRRSHSRHSRGRSPHRSPRSSRRDASTRDRFSGGRTRSTNTHNLIGQPIRHDRSSRKWEEPSGSGTARNQMLTPQTIENRLKQGLAILQTPRTNPIYSLDELNYPAAPQWYMKAVAFYNKKHGHRRPAGVVSKDPSYTTVVAQNDQESVDARYSDTSLTSDDSKVFESAEQAESVGVSAGEENSQEGVVAIMDTVPSEPNKAQDADVKIEPLFPAASTSVESQGVSSRPSTADADLRVSIPLSDVSVTPVTTATQSITPTDNDDFNYDDYLDQLNDEEEDDTGGGAERMEKTKVTSSTEQKALPLFQNEFWIDTKPSDNSNPVDQSTKSSSPIKTQPLQTTSSDPLEEDFPSVSKDQKPDSKPDEHINNSLRALVSQDSIDDIVASEEGKDVRAPAKKNKSARRKQKDRQWIAKQEMLKRDQELAPKLRQPCKYFQSGYCVHGDKCQYSHDIIRDRKKEVCKFYLQDGCSKGNNCLFLHGEFPCKFHHTGSVCFHGDKCKFSHAPLTRETYDMLMTVIDPNLCDKVPLPGQQPPAVHPAHQQQQLSPTFLPPRPLLPLQHDFQQPPLRPMMSRFPPRLPQPLPPPPPQPWSGPPRMPPPANIDLPGFQPSAVPPRPPGIPPRLSPPPQQWSNAPGSAPFPGHPPQSDFPNSGPFPDHPPQSDRTDAWQDQNFSQRPQTDAAQTQPQTKLDSNVSLPPTFDVKSLFPDPHPQILPHDLATKLRKTLLPTPSTSNTSQPSLELEYWENPEQQPTDSPPPSASSSPPPSSSSTHQPYPADGPQYPIPPPHPPRPPTQSSHFNSPPSLASHDPFTLPPPHRGAVAAAPLPSQHLPPNHPPPNHPLPPPPPSHSHHPPPDQNRQDPRFSRQRAPPPPHPSFRPPPMQQQPPYPPAFSGPPVMAATPEPLLGPPQQQQPPPTSNNADKMAGAVREGEPEWGMSGDRARPLNSNPSTGVDRPVETKRSVDPRLKYAHLKIKSRSGASSASTATTSSSTDASSTNKYQNAAPQHSFAVPSLLQDRSKLSKPLAPFELFGGTEDVSEPAEQGPISLFGSSKYYSKPSVPASPLANKQAFGEIKMETVSSQESLNSQSSEMADMSTEEADKEESDFVPSYLTHLGLEKDSDTSGLKIDSAFGDLKERQRRLSEIGSSISEESRDEGLVSPKHDNGSPKLTKMFSFGSDI